MKERGQDRSFSLCKFFPKKCRGQVTIFIIIAIMIIGGVLLFFIFREKIIPGMSTHPEKNPGTFLESCSEDKIREALSLLSSQGGSINPILYKKFRFEDESDFTNISYLCYTQNYYIPCINQEPLLIQHLKKELKDYISEDISDCFDKLTASLNKQGYTTDAKYRGFDIELMERKIMINIDAEITLTKSGETSTQNDFRVVIPSRFYDSALVAQEIVSQEARF